MVPRQLFVALAAVAAVAVLPSVVVGQVLSEEDSIVVDPIFPLNVQISTRDTGTYCYEGNVPLRMECRLNYPNITDYVVLPPEVEWLYSPYTNITFKKLEEYGRYFYQEKRFCQKNVDESGFTCRLEIEKACSPDYDGYYQCKMIVEFKRGEVGHYSAARPVAHGSLFDQSGLICFMPKVTAFRAQLVGNSSIYMEWDTSQNLKNKEFCDRSRRFSVKVYVYDSFKNYMRNRTSHYSPYFVSTTKRRDTNFSLPLNSTYSVKKFYVFSVRNRIIRGVIQAGQEAFKSNIYYSEVFYFGQKELLSLTNPVHQVEKKVFIKDALVKIECEARGFPLPTVTMWFENNLIEPRRPDIQVPKVSRTLLARNSNTGRYQCNAVGYYLSPNGGAFIHSTVKYIDVEVIEPQPHAQIVCMLPFNTISRCSRFLGRHNIIQNTSNSDFFGSVDMMVATLENLTGSTALGTSRRCLEAAQAVVCHSSFPFCFNNVTRRKVCSRTCDLFRKGGACADVIDAGAHPDVMNAIFSSCDGRVDEGGAYPECIHVPFDTPDTAELQEASWCSLDRGTTYAGVVKYTSSGQLCQDWTSQTPHQHATYSGGKIYGAKNQCRNPDGRGTAPWCYTASKTNRWEYCDGVPQCEICAPYTETFCRSLPGYDQNVYVNRHESEWNRRGLDGAELWMNRAWHSLSVEKYNFSSSCLLYLKEYLCHRTVPLCGTAAQQGSVITPMKLCSDHCKASKIFRACPGNLVSKLEAAMQSDGATFSKLDCSFATGENSSTCMASNAFSLATASLLAMVDDTCYRIDDRGASYNGTVSVTESGASCRPWGSALPGAGNYCRNLLQTTSRPWCYTGNTTWEHCSVPTCPNGAVLAASSSGISATPLPTSSSYWFIALSVLFVAIGFLIIGVGIAIAVVVVRRKRKNQKSEYPGKLNTPSSNWDYVRNTMYNKVEVSPKECQLRKLIETFPQFDKSSIHYVRQIGQGNFGVVFYAKAEGVVEGEKLTEVAVKTLKDETCSESFEDFAREAKLMFSFNHKNIVKIFGVAMENVPYYLVFEYMDKGDLAHFLRANASSSQRRLMEGRSRSRTESTLSNEGPGLMPEELQDICKQIACGMQYLAENKHIHRDLACRNCLVKSANQEQTDSELIVKIGDFGMSHNLYSSDYYRVKGSAILPVRWMSPEAIIYGKFSTESDVWSFGVVMWEVFSFAMQPYYGTSNEEVTEAIRRHRILKQPADCSYGMYEIMKQCWNREEKLRPSFEELYALLDDFCVSSRGSPSIDIDSDVDNSDMDSDAFLEENSVDNMDACL